MSKRQRVLRPRKILSDDTGSGRRLCARIRKSKASADIKNACQARPKRRATASHSRTDSMMSSDSLGSTLPPELWSLIFRCLGPLDLASTSCVCQFFQAEAESLLYNMVCLCKVREVHIFYRAISSSPRRAAAVRRLWALDNGCLGTVISMIGHILQLVINVTELNILLIFKDQKQIENLWIQLNKCTFQLEHFGSNVTVAPGCLAFLARQPRIKILFTYVNTIEGPVPVLPPDVLPSLRVLSTSKFIMPYIHHPRNITHLAVVLTDQSAVDNILRLLGHQLISLSLVRLVDDDRFPTGVFRNVQAPALRFLEVRDTTLNDIAPMNMEMDVTNMVQPGVVVERFMWVPERMQSENFLGLYGTTLSDVRSFAKASLETWKSLRQFVYMASEDIYTLCTLGKDGQLVEEDVTTITQWNEV